jgi:hypothetical protein
MSVLAILLTTACSAPAPAVQGGDDLQGRIG